MMRSTSSVVVALLLAISVAVVAGWPTSALGPDDGRPDSAPAPSATSPLLDALAFAPPEIISFEFTDWAALKALHDGSDITSASPLDERQRLVLDMVHSEASGIDFGLGRLATWPELWGWDNTDLVWEATWVPWFDSSAKILRFHEGWDPKPFMAQLEGYGYSRREKPHGTVFGDAPDFLPDPGIEAILDADERLSPWPASVAISADGRMVVIGEGDRAHKILKTAAQAESAAVAASPYGRIAVALGRPVTALIVDGDLACSDVGLGNGGFPDDMTTLAASVGPFQRYQAFGIGYERAGPGEAAVGRYAFAYKRANQAKADLPGRRTLIDKGYASRSARPSQDVALTSGDASADRRTLALDVALLDDAPQLLFNLLSSRSESPVACPALQPTPSGPLAPLGPTTSGGRTEMPGSGFAVGFPADWSVEVAEPDLDLALALPGDVWEALRAYAPGRHQTCSVYVVVVTPGSADPQFMRTPGLRKPRWSDSATQPVLQIPDPRDRVEEPSGFWSGASGDFDRSAANDPVLDHDVVYALHCAADVDTSYDSIYESFTLLPVE